MPAFLRSRLNLTLLLSLIVQAVLLGTGKTEVNEASVSALGGNVIGLLLRVQDDGQKRKAKG